MNKRIIPNPMPGAHLVAAFKKVPLTLALSPLRSERELTECRTVAVPRWSRIISNPIVVILWFVLACRSSYANPQGLKVVSGSAHTTQQGNTLQINTSQGAVLNWNSFNIGAGQTTIFHEPTTTSIVFNNINNANPTTIYGSLQANGIVVLENQAGFYFGPHAFVRAGGLVVTTAAINPWASGGGAEWSFNGPPAAAPIVNYGCLQTASAGSLFLIGKDIDNQGTISASGGTAALVAGEEVLLSERPNGLSLSAPVRLPTGSVNNQGTIVANAGQVLLQAQNVNNSGVIQANSAREHNGVIELYASQDLQLGSTSVIQANGDTEGISQGGNITLKSGGTFSDSAGSQISAQGGTAGGNGGKVEVSAPTIQSLNSTIDAGAAAGWLGGRLLLDPSSITIGNSGSGSADGGTVAYNNGTGALDLNVNSAFVGLSQITLQSTGNITLAPGTTWDLSASTGKTTGQLTLEAAGNITFGASGNPSEIQDENSWSVTLQAGYNFTTGRVVSGTGNVTLNDFSYISMASGNINVVAGNNVMVGSGGIVTGIANGAVITGPGGNINVQALGGSVNCGSSPSGYLFTTTGVGYNVDPNLGGISTANGGNVTIQAGGNITAALPVATSTVQSDFGSGAFGAAPGNVTLTAGGDVTGHYVVANGTGLINAANAGDATLPLALSLVTGGWEVNATENILLQEVRNPNGMFNDTALPSGVPASTQYLFNYNPLDSVVLNAGDGVTISGADLPRINGRNTHEGLIFPSTLEINAGAGGITLDTSVNLFPSPVGTLEMTTTGGGNLSSAVSGVPATIYLSESQSTQWQNPTTFTPLDVNQNLLLHLNDPNPVLINISGSVNDIDLNSPKPVEMYVGGNIIDSSAAILQLLASDTSVISAGGEILDHSGYALLTLPVGETPNFEALLTVASPWLNAISLLPVESPLGIPTIANPNYNPVLANQELDFAYNAASGTLKYPGIMSQAVEQALLGMKSPFLPAATIEEIYAATQLDATHPLPGYSIAGPGKFQIDAASIDLGNSAGIASLGLDGESVLARYTPRGADLDISVSGDLTMLSSTIDSDYGGSINVTCGGTITLGSALVPAFSSVVPLGIVSLWGGNISVIAYDDVDVDGSRIAAYDGGDVFVESLTGNVNAGVGGNGFVLVTKPYLNKEGQVADLYEIIPGSGILATSFPQLVYGEKTEDVGNITVETPEGNIIASKGGISQLSLSPASSDNATVTLVAGSKNYVGNVDASGSGVIGGQVDISATGNIDGLVVARVGADLSALQNVNATVLSSGGAQVSAGGTVSGTIVGVGNVSVTGASDVAAAFSSGAVSVSGAVGGAAAPAAPAGSSSASAAATSQQVTQSTQSNSQLADNGSESEEEKKKRLAKTKLMEYVGRVTVLLPE